MKAFVRHALLSLAVTVGCQTGLALAESYYGASSGKEAPSAAGEQKVTAPAQASCCVEESKCAEKCSPDSGCEGCLCTAMDPCRRCWYIDYRIRPMFDSHTSYEFGTDPSVVPAYAPRSRLDWSLDSTWHGLQVGLERPNWDVHFEWLTPMARGINGNIADSDWDGPNRDPFSLTLSSERWIDGQMLDLGGEFKLTDCFFTLPLEVWPTAGFRFQRFNMTAYNLDSIIPPLGPQRQYDGVDVATFNQQYYIGYIGGQLRTTLCVGRTPIDVRFQGDWGATSGYNVDHHLLYEQVGVHQYSMESTQGGTMHLALIAEAPLTGRVSVGLQADHTEIRTTGSIHFLRYGPGTLGPNPAVPPADQTWTNGVSAKSDQTSLTAFVRARF